MTNIRLAILGAALVLGGCNTMNDFVSRIDFFKEGSLVKLEPKTKPAAKGDAGYVHIAALNSADELIMTLPDMSSEPVVLRRSGNDFVAIDTGYVHIAESSPTNELIMTLSNMTPNTLLLRRSGSDFVTVSTADPSMRAANFTSEPRQITPIPAGMDMENVDIEMYIPIGADS